MRKAITKRQIDALEPGGIIADKEIRGFVARRLPSGLVTYGLRYRADGERWWLRLGDGLTPAQARRLAQKKRGEVADGRNPMAEAAAAREAARAQAAAEQNTVDWVLDAFLNRYVRGDANLRSADEIERCFRVYVRPALGSRPIYELRRSEIAEMMDKVADNNGPVMADRTLAYLRKALAWWATRDDRFNSPIVRGMARTKPADRARDRILADDELRDLWAVLDSLSGPYPGIVRLALFTAQRRDEVSRMRWDEIEGRVWTIPALRYKTGKPNVVPLSDQAAAVLAGIKRDKGPFVFSTTHGRLAFANLGKSKKLLDLAINTLRQKDRRKPMKPWRLHDLRRTARSLLSRAGVLPHVAEQVLGHKIPGVADVYDRHDYAKEKAEALKALGLLVLQITSPADNVLSLQRHKAKA